MSASKPPTLVTISQVYSPNPASVGQHMPDADIDQRRAMPPEELQAMGDEAAGIVQERFQQRQMIDEFTEIMLGGIPIQNEPVAKEP